MKIQVVVDWHNHGTEGITFTCSKDLSFNKVQQAVEKFLVDERDFDEDSDSYTIFPEDSEVVDLDDFVE